MNTVVDMLDQEVSEDGNWKWNGTDWVPNVPPPIQQVILEKSNTDSTKTRVSDLNFNTKTLSIVGGIVFLLFTTSISYYYFFMEEERTGEWVYLEWHYGCVSDCEQVYVYAENVFDIEVYDGYKIINDDNWGTPIKESYFLFDDEIYFFSGIVQRESSEQSYVSIFGTASLIGYDVDSACVVWDGDDMDSYATASGVDWFTVGTLRNNDC